MAFPKCHLEKAAQDSQIIHEQALACPRIQQIRIFEEVSHLDD
jgi:hypothetical protein